MASKRWRVLVCGTKFGRVYMSALAEPSLDMELAGILAAGSERSRHCAERLGVPLYTDIAQLPEDLDAACVVVSSEMGGGVGSEIARRLLERGLCVLQEHPMHHSELTRATATALRCGVVHRMNTLYPHVRAVRQFLAAGAALLDEHPAAYLDGACSLQLKTSFLDIIGRLLGKFRPWSFEALARQSNDRGLPVPFQSVQGKIGGVPVTLRLQNQLHARDPDNHAYLYHQLTLGTSVGSLTLVDTHGPIVWRPRPHIPGAIQREQAPESAVDPALSNPTTSTLMDKIPTWREAMTTDWPQAVGRALVELRGRSEGQRLGPDEQYYLSLLQMVHDFDFAVGPPEVIRSETPRPQSAATLRAAIAAVP
jgi:pyochelin biosynthesis protein PchG